MRWLLVLVAGCFSPTPPAGAPCGEPPSCPSNLTCIGGFCLAPGSVTDAATDPDAPSDTLVVPPDACENFAGQLDACDLSPGTAIVLAGGQHTYNTDTQELTDPVGTVIPTTSAMVTGLAGPIVVLVTQSFEITQGSLRVIGDIPFGVVSFGDITITGTINADGDGGGGAGRRGSALCPAGVGRNGTTDSDGSSGAGGGGFQGNGGKGGEGDENQVPVGPGDGGSDVSAVPAGPLGGCRGGTGGGGADVGGTPGQGGGAVYLVSQTAITIDGVLDAGGGGGGHGHSLNGGGGGGGGGSGGMIILEAPSVIVSGVLAANGGGGGGGADDVAPNDGVEGEAGRLDTTRAAGGSGAGDQEGGDGGLGGAGTATDGLTANEVADNGGGGGGGGVGFIAIGSPQLTTPGAVITPVLSTWPLPP